MTTHTPPAAEPLTLKIPVLLGGFRFSPEVIKADGLTTKRTAELVLDTEHKGDAGSAQLLDFLTHVRGDLKIEIKPTTLDDDGTTIHNARLVPWAGVGTVGTVKLQREGGTSVTFPLRISSSSPVPLEKLIRTRLAMAQATESTAYLELEAVQPDLGFQE